MPDTEQLRALTNSDDCAMAFLELASQRERNQNATNVERALTNLTNAGFDFSRSQLIVVLKKLDELGYGEFKTGRRGLPSRFEWHYSITDVGRTALGLQDVVDDVSVDDEEIDADLDWLTHTFHLRPNLEIEIVLPTDLSPDEPKRFSQFITSIPFELG